MQSHGARFGEKVWLCNRKWEASASRKGEKMIVVEDLTKRYGDHTAVDHLSFQVEKGRIYGFLGPNGAGKSTTMNMITGYLAPTGGKVLIDGKDIQRDPEEARRMVGYLPELPPLYMDMTVDEYLVFAAELKKVPAKERRAQVDEVMGMVGITDMKGRLIKNLSKGYKQRVGLAQAILGNPEVLILDEPSVGLDPKQIIEMRELIKKLGEDHTIILSSHILSEVSAVCDHIMIIAHGRLVASDSPEGLKKRLEGSLEIILTAKGGEDVVKGILQGQAGIIDTEKLDTEEAGCVRFRILCREGFDAREALFFAFAKAGIPILEMSHREKSLEDVYLELTEGAKPEEKPVKKGLFGRKKGRKAEAAGAETASESAAEGKAENAEGKTEATEGKAENAESGASAGKTETAESSAAEGKTKIAESSAAEGKAEMAEGKAEAAEGKAEAAEGKTEAAEGKTEAAEGKTEAAAGKAEVAEGKAEVAEGKTESVEGQEVAGNDSNL